MPEFDISEFIRTLTHGPGVYQMIDGEGEILYVGKARDLRKRVASYFRRSGLQPKTLAMVQRVARIEVTRTHTENEAFLLENNLIKKHRPRYNIDFRDDKSYPYIHLDDAHEFPRLGFYRGSRKEPGRFFGPYANAGAVRDTLAQLQKIFPVRQCEDTFYRSRSRPCLQYQIKRCTAPCVGLVERPRYLEDVKQAILFLEGKDQRLNEMLAQQMEQASARLDFETAAHCRDRIRALRRVQEHQYISGAGGGDMDVVALHAEAGIACVEVVFVRGGRHSGSKAFFPKISLELTSGQIMAAFLSQFYANKSAPAEILVRPAPQDKSLLETMLRSNTDSKVRVVTAPRGHRARFLDGALVNARNRLQQHLAGRASQAQRLEELRVALDLEDAPQRIECFDASHTAGEATVVSCVVFDQDGPVKSDYRRYNIKEITPGDDYAALAQALSRRYAKIQGGAGKLPDLILIDGGKGQLARANAVLEELQVDGVALAAVAKGSTRRPGLERIFVHGRTRALHLEPMSGALHLLQQIRDEAHRFAITGHRQRRSRSRLSSPLQEIPGVGNKRRQALLTHLGGLQEVIRAGVEDLASVPGISPDLARRIYAHFHAD